jgi:hypothetical protein
MTRKCGFRLLTATLLLLVAPLTQAAPVPETQTALDQVPATAPLVFHLSGIERTKDRVLALMNNALPDQAPMVAEFLNKALKEGFDGRSLRGVPKDGHVFLAFLEMPRDFSGPPKAGLIVAVEDYAKFRDALLKDEERKSLEVNKEGGYESTAINGETIFFINKKTYAVITPTKEAASDFAKSYNGLGGKLSKELTDKLLGHDFGVYLSMDVFNKDYAEQIKTAKEAVNDQFLKQLEDSGAVDKSMIDLYKNMIQTTFQAVEDSQGALATVDFQSTGLALHVQSELRANTPTAVLLKGSKPVAFADLDKFPADHAYYTAMKLSPAVFKSMGALAYGVTTGEDDKGAKEVKAAIDELMKAGPQEHVQSFGFPYAALTVQHYEDAAKAADAQLKLMEALQPGVAYRSMVLKDKAVLKRKAEKYHGFDLAEIRMKPDLEKMVEKADRRGALPEAAKKDMADMFKKLFGETVTSWVGTDGVAVYTVAAKDWKTAEKALDDYFAGKNTVGSEAGYKVVRKGMPAEATLYTLIDPIRFGGFMADFLKMGFGAAHLPPNWPALPATQKATFFGVAVSLKPERGALDLFFSADAVQETYKAFVKPLMPGGAAF